MRVRRFFFRVLVAGVAITPVLVGAASRPAPQGTGGAVSSAEHDATMAGVEVLSAGGNAADAAVATALALAVVHPQAGNLGGGGFAVVRFAGEVTTLDFRETAPRAAHRDMYLGDDGSPVREASWIGPLAAGVPGSPVGLHELHARFGTLPWPRVVEPAIRLAGRGFAVSSRLVRDIESEKELLSRFPAASAVYLPDGEPPDAGTTMVLPDLAATLRSYAESGPGAIVEGPVAAAIERASMRHGGILTVEDLAAYRAVWRPPVLFRAFGWSVASMALPSSGGIILGQTLLIVEKLGWGSLPRFGAHRNHMLAETFRRAFADRFLLGDPDTTRATVAQLLDARWLGIRAGQIRTGRATPSKEVRPWAGDPLSEPEETTHLSVVDGDGNAVSLTTTLNGWFGCGLLVEGAGFFLNNEMDDFAAAPGRANTYGIVQGEANAVAPGKRMLSSMSPTVAWSGDDVLVLGSPGGPRIPTATAQVFLNLVVDSDELQAAVNRPRVHHQWLPDVLFAEPDALSPETAAALEGFGHELRDMASIGKVNVVRRSSEGAAIIVKAAADPRGPGVAAVQNPAPR